jgi:hypothetical protein
MEVVFSDEAERDFLALERQLQVYFRQHLLKLVRMPPRRHMGKGLPFQVENVTGQARFVYEEKEGVLRVIRCFVLHKEYEAWYSAFKR